MSAPIDTEIDQELERIQREAWSILHGKVREELHKARSAVESYKEQVKRLEVKLDRVEQRMLGLHEPAPVTVEVGEGGRVKKGLSEHLIVDFLKASNGIGATVHQIKDATGTTLSTTRRIVNKLANEQKVESAAHSRWKWKSDEPEIEDAENNLSVKTR